MCDVAADDMIDLVRQGGPQEIPAIRRLTSKRGANFIVIQHRGRLRAVYTELGWSRARLVDASLSRADSSCGVWPISRRSGDSDGMTTLLSGRVERHVDASPGGVFTHSCPIMFVSDQCTFAYEAVLDLMSWWAGLCRNHEYIDSCLEDAKHELARGTDRVAVARHLMALFRGTAAEDIVVATRAYLRSLGDVRFSSSTVPEALDAAGELVLVSDLPLFSLLDGLEGFGAVLSTMPACVDGFVTGELPVVLQGRHRREAMERFAFARGVPLTDCAHVHRGGAEDVQAVNGVGVAVDLLCLPQVATGSVVRF